MKHIFFCLVHAAALSLAAPAFASPFYPTEAAVFFSPNGGAENAIVRSIDSAKSRIRMQAFLFSNKEITGALIRAHQRGVKVDVIIDKKMPKKKRIRPKISSKPASRLSLIPLTAPRTTKSSLLMMISFLQAASISSKLQKPKTGKTS